MSVLSELFKECPQVKVLEIFAENSDKMLYLTEIGEKTNITKITVADHINKLLMEGIIEKKEKVGRKQYYQLNKYNPKAKIILSLVKHIEDKHLGELIEKEIMADTEISTSEVSTNNKFISSYSPTSSSSGCEHMKINSTRKQDF